MSPTRPFFSQLSLRIRTSTGAQWCPPFPSSFGFNMRGMYVQRAVTTKPTKHVSCLLDPVSRKHIRLRCKGMQGCVLVPAPRLLSPLQDPRPPTPELPDQFVEEHVETPSHQEAPLPDTILGGRGVTVVHSQASVSPLDSGTNRMVFRLFASYAHTVYICIPEVDPEVVPKFQYVSSLCKSYSKLSYEPLQISTHIHTSIPSPFLDFKVHFVHFPLPGMALFVEMDVRNCCALNPMARKGASLAP